MESMSFTIPTNAEPAQVVENYFVDTRTDRELLLECLAALKRIDARSAAAETIANEVAAAFEEIKSKPMIAKMLGLG